MLLQDLLSKATGNLPYFYGVGEAIVKDGSFVGTYNLCHPCQSAERVRIEDAISILGARCSWVR